jgi:hypothetical protein
MNYQASFIPHGITGEEANRLDSTGMVKQHCKNDRYMSSSSLHDALSYLVFMPKPSTHHMPVP